MVDGNAVNGRSIMGLMMLAASMARKVEITARGPDAGEALTAMLALVEAKFGEDDFGQLRRRNRMPSPARATARLFEGAGAAVLQKN